MIIVRFADDVVVGYEHESDARRFWDAMRERLQEFSLSLHPDKTRLIEFGRHAADRRARRAWQTGDLQVPGLHFHLRTLAPGQVPAQTENPTRSHADSSARSRRNCDGECTSRYPNKDDGWRKS